MMSSSSEPKILGYRPCGRDSTVQEQKRVVGRRIPKAGISIIAEGSTRKVLADRLGRP